MYVDPVNKKYNLVYGQFNQVDHVNKNTISHKVNSIK